MTDFSPNHYERAFENWLLDNRIRYVRADEHRRTSFGRSDIKSFDFLVEAPSGLTTIAEVKGRTFKGASLAKMAGFECWVTSEDVDGLGKWQQILGGGQQAVFVFAYRIENIDVDFDGMDILDFDNSTYLFFCVRLEDYRKFMKRRSPKWRTVTLPAEKFRESAVHISKFLL
ncbi:MAG: HYExAFE family protein [Woeseiaceae bacterium]|nr:HYExAFE family protein [Woeseiaceae bacterium]